MSKYSIRPVSEEDIARLPKWAQRHIKNLTRQIDDLEAERRAVSAGESDVYYDVGVKFDERVWLPPRATVHFVLGPRHQIYIHVVEDGLRIYFDGPLLVHPGATNSITLT